MKFRVRLRQLLQEHNLSIAEVARATALEPNQITRLGNDASPHLVRDVIEKIVAYFVDNDIAERDEVLAMLFTLAPEQFWELLYPCSQVTMCVGVRRDPKYKDQLVSAADTVLQADVLYKLTDTAFRRKKERPKSSASESDISPALPILDTQLIDAWFRHQDNLNRDNVIEQAKKCYQGFTNVEGGGDRALICFGSIKSNPVIECVTASCFNADPFVSSDGVSSPQERPCPFMFAYRPKDPQPKSICGGLKLSNRGKKKAQPGIHYETPEGVWECAPWTEDENDAALVMYRFLRRTGQLEMVLGGFSGRGTRCLAKFIRDPRYDEGELWPPGITGDTAFDKNGENACNVDLGVCIVQFELEPPEAEDADGPVQTPEFRSNPRVIRLESESLKKRAGLAV